MGNIGSSELLIIFVLALLLLGPRRLPEVGEALGRTIRKFRQASRDLRDDLDIKKDLDPTGELRRDLDLGRDLRESAPRETQARDTQARDTQAREQRRREAAPVAAPAEDEPHTES